MKTAKKLYICAAAALTGFILFAQNNSTDLTPLAGIWENPSRIISVNKDNSLQFVLKTFYGFYFDKAAVLTASLDSGENGETILRVKYPSEKKPQAHPIGVINNKLFLDFYCRSYIETDEEDSEYYEDEPAKETHNSPLYGYWRSCGNVNGIEIAVPLTKKELTCYYFTDSEVYLLRYWQADVPYERELVNVNDGDFSFKVDKLLKVGDVVYTCVVGRGTFVRNFEKTTYTINGSTVTFGSKPEKEYPLFISQDGSLVSFSEPYIIRSEISDLDSAIAEHNSHTHNPLKNPMEVFNRKTAWEEKLEKMTIN